MDLDHGFEVQELPYECPTCGRVGLPSYGSSIGLPIQYWDCCERHLFIGPIEDLVVFAFHFHSPADHNALLFCSLKPVISLNVIVNLFNVPL